MSKTRIPRGWAKEIKNIEKLSDIVDEATMSELLSTPTETKQERKRKRKAVVLKKLTTPEKPPPPPPPPSLHPDDVRAMMPPRAILFRKQTAVFSVSGPMYDVGGTSFAQINALLKTRNDARTEAWDSLPKQF
mgnify:CR=1 FL=1